jgi:pantoate--beta-alanine ligase
MKVTRTVVETRAAVAALPRPLGFVPTMGAIHAGHLALVDAAEASCAATVASLFVNPAQFGEGEDLADYPRDEARDMRVFAQAGVDVVFVPTADDLYPDGFCTQVRIKSLSEHLEGAVRPVHFEGVALIVTKLFNIVRPDLAFFGRKDAQQLAVVRRLARDLDLGVEVIGVPTVREPDGLALSSRNIHLTADERAVAPDLHRALQAGARAAAAPGSVSADVLAAASRALTPAFTIDYLAVVDADTFEQTDHVTERSLLVAAARLGRTRLLDNVRLSPSAYPERDATARKGA